MPYVFIWDSMKNEMSNNLFLKTIGSSLIGKGFTLSNFLMITDKTECILLDLPFGSAIIGEIYLVNNKSILVLDQFYDISNKYSKKIVSCFYNSCGCNKDAYEKTNCFIYCINNPKLIENHVKNIDKKYFIVNTGNWQNFLISESETI